MSETDNHHNDSIMKQEDVFSPSPAEEMSMKAKATTNEEKAAIRRDDVPLLSFSRPPETEEERQVRSSLLRVVLPACQPQEGSPANTFTTSELQELKAAMQTAVASMNIRPRTDEDLAQQSATRASMSSPGDADTSRTTSSADHLPIEAFSSSSSSHHQHQHLHRADDNVLDIRDWTQQETNKTGDSNFSESSKKEDKQEEPDSVTPISLNDPDSVPRHPSQTQSSVEQLAVAPSVASAAKQRLVESSPLSSASPLVNPSFSATPNNWHGAPRFAPNAHIARSFREEQCRTGAFTSSTNGQCCGFLQCNLVVLPQEWAFDFLLFCQRNPQCCPLIEVCTTPHPDGVAMGADLRTDIPKYSIYRDGVLTETSTDVRDVWPEDAVAFLIGCSFSYDGALLNAGIPLRSAEMGLNVPMYETSIPCRPAGKLAGNMVVSMKPIPAMQIAKHCEVTSKYRHAHGGPVCIARPNCLGIDDLEKPDWGDCVPVALDEVPVFHACGVTPQAVLKSSKVPFAITHAPGHMFITDLPADMGVE